MMIKPIKRILEPHHASAYYVPMPSKQESTTPKRVLADEAPDGTFVLTSYQADNVTIHDDIRSISAWSRVPVSSNQELPPPLIPPLPHDAKLPWRCVPDIAYALNARAVLVDNPTEHDAGNPLAAEIVKICLTTALCLPNSERWRQAVSDALLGDWVAPLTEQGRLTPLALGALKAEARSIHRQLVPLWRRGTRHGRTLSLDFPIGDGLSLYDLIARHSSTVDSMPRNDEGDLRLAALLRALAPEERRVVHAWAQRGIATWADAAWYAGSLDPETTGERVRRRVRYVVAEQKRRRAQQLPSETPDEEGHS
ncbi:hypothetical protein [Streptomyces sp. NBC_00328]|uniref:hypothetical protein n=1 Tax=Streptomyces sp. NBC_00328 TaxID=2903646 RepID=UPI002E2BEAC8|nr:hypothetical protein [Streptomyces sp. NBC_00328]